MVNYGSINAHINSLEDHIVKLCDFIERMLDVTDMDEGFILEAKVTKEIKEIKSEMPSLFKR